MRISVVIPALDEAVDLPATIGALREHEPPPFEVIVAEAYRDAQKMKGEGDAKSTAIYSQAYENSPEFYAFYRSLEAYRSSFKGRNDIIVVEPNSDFFKYMKSMGRGGDKAVK